MRTWAFLGTVEEDGFVIDIRKRDLQVSRLNQAIRGETEGE